MRFKKLVPALVACLALSAVAATGAQAALQWTVNEPAEVLSSETIDAYANPGDIPWEFSSKVGLATVDLVDEGVSCVGECSISGAGKSKVKLKFSKVTVSVPHCAVAGGTFTTKALKGQVFMDSLFPTSTFDLVEPAEGTTFVEVQLENEGGTCALGTSLTFTGSLVGEATNPTGGLTSDWMMRFRPDVQELVDPEGGLKLGTQKVKAQGYTHDELIGEHKGAKFGIME